LKRTTFLGKQKADHICQHFSSSIKPSSIIIKKKLIFLDVVHTYIHAWTKQCDIEKLAQFICSHTLLCLSNLGNKWKFTRPAVEIWGPVIVTSYGNMSPSASGTLGCVFQD